MAFLAALLQLVVATLLIAVQVAIQMALSYFLGETVDAGVLASTGVFRSSFVGLLVCWLAGDVAFYWRFRWLRRAAELVVYDLRQSAVAVLSRTRLSLLEEKHSGDLISRLSNDMRLIHNLIGQEWFSLVYGLLAFIAALIMMLYYSWSVTLGVLLTIPLIGLVANRLGALLTRHTTAMQVELAEVNALAQDAIAGIAVSKAFNLQSQLGERFRRRNERVATEGAQLLAYQGALNGAMMVLTMLPVFIVFGYGGYQVIGGQLTLGSLMVLINLLNNLTWPLNRMTRSLAQARAGLAAAARVLDLLELEQERTGGNELVVDTSAPALALQSVHFSYNPTQPILADLNLEIAHGEKVALVGTSGSGKSTLFSLLLGLREPQRGRILFYGQPLPDLSLASLRSSIAYVSQEALLFPTTIARNIAYGNLPATSAAIKQAAQDAYADQFIVDLPAAYETNLGELGDGLSGGQKQRIALARAVIKDAPLLLLDEATSALDTESEAKVQVAIARLSQGRTTLIIAHRLSTLRGVDRIVVLDQGRIVETGSQDELLRLNGVYARLYAQQTAESQTADPAVGSQGVN